MASKIKLLSKVLGAAAVWYFLAYTSDGGYVQVGPFASQHACENYRTQVGGSPCWSSTAK